MSTQGYVVVLRNKEAGVTVFPNVPDSQGLTDLMRSQVQGSRVQDPPQYLKKGEGSVLGFTVDRADAQVFATSTDAQAAIDRMPSMVRPAGLTVEAISG